MGCVPGQTEGKFAAETDVSIAMPCDEFGLDISGSLLVRHALVHDEYGGLVATRHRIGHSTQRLIAETAPVRNDQWPPDAQSLELLDQGVVDHAIGEVDTRQIIYQRHRRPRQVAAFRSGGD
jgi:hypothetical protein